MKRFESLQLIKTICVCINPLKVGSTENYTYHLLTELEFLLMSVQSQIIIIIFISVA